MNTPKLPKTIECLSVDYSKLEAVEVQNIYTWDAPDFCDAFISYAEYNKRPLTNSELSSLNDNSSLIYEYVLEKLY